MTRRIRQAISIAPDHNKPKLSRGQKAFNTLIRQIEKRRERCDELDRRSRWRGIPFDRSCKQLAIRTKEDKGLELAGRGYRRRNLGGRVGQLLLVAGNRLRLRDITRDRCRLE